MSTMRRAQLLFVNGHDAAVAEEFAARDHRHQHVAPGGGEDERGGGVVDGLLVRAA